MRRGQAALEYLITYGWGFLVIIVVVGGLAYFGLFSPSRYIPARCEFGGQLECVDYRLNSAGTIQLQFRNNFGDDILIVSAYSFDETAASTITGSPITIVKGNTSSILTITPSSTAQFVRDDRISVPMIVTFRRATGTNPPLHNITGEIFATVQ
jgi:hypothetical protein